MPRHLSFKRNNMFRNLTRKNKEISKEECIDLLCTETRGVLSVNGDEGYPYGMPMNHFYNENDGCIYFHCGRSGHRTDSLKKSSKVSFCVFEQGEKYDGDWAYNVRSVVVFGKIEIIDSIEEVKSIAEMLCRKFTDDSEYIKNEIDTHASATLLLKLTPEHICGKKIKEA